MSRTDPTPDLQQAIHAGAAAIDQWWKGMGTAEVSEQVAIASLVVEAAAPVLLQAAQAEVERLRDLLQRSISVENYHNGRCLYCLQREHEGASRRHAHCWQCGQRNPEHLDDCPIYDALDQAAQRKDPQ